MSKNILQLLHRYPYRWPRHTIISPFLFVILRSLHFGWANKKIIFVEAFPAMYESLIKYFNSYTTIPLTENEIDSIKSVFVSKKFRKRQYFLQEGEVCKYTAFVIKGAMRQYR